MSANKYMWSRVTVSLMTRYTKDVLPLWRYDYRYHLRTCGPHDGKLARHQIIQFRDEMGMYYVRDIRAHIEGYGKDSCIQPPYKKLAEAKRVVEMLLAMEGERI